MQGMQREFQTIPNQVLHADKHSYKQGASEASSPACNIITSYQVKVKQLLCEYVLMLSPAIICIEI